VEQTQASLSDLLGSDAALLANVSFSRVVCCARALFNAPTDDLTLVSVQLEASLAENAQVFQSNIQQLDDRMAKLLASSGGR